MKNIILLMAILGLIVICMLLVLYYIYERNDRPVKIPKISEAPPLIEPKTEIIEPPPLKEVETPPLTPIEAPRSGEVQLPERQFEEAREEVEYIYPEEEGLDTTTYEKREDEIEESTSFEPEKGETALPEDEIESPLPDKKIMPLPPFEPIISRTGPVPSQQESPSGPISTSIEQGEEVVEGSEPLPEVSGTSSPQGPPVPAGFESKPLPPFTPITNATGPTPTDKK